MPLTLDRPPKTILEVYRMLPEGTRAELINGTLFMSPAPLVNHQEVITVLLTQIHFYAKKMKAGRVFPSPIDVYLNQKNAFQPDIVFVSAGNKIIKEDGIYGAPDLVIEVLSAGTAKTDLNRKKGVYEKEGVKEYWVVDPKTKTATGFRLVGSKYQEFSKEKGKLHSNLLKQVFKF
jgi:Uma2 family endonuclease